MHVRIATRKSPLALWQANHVREELLVRHASLSVELVERTTKGDRILDQALSKVGGKDLFVKEIEDAILSGAADIAVHSLKDMPTDLPEALHIAAFMRREDPRDALVSPKGFTLSTLPTGARIGTSSLRRQAQLLALRPDLVIVPLRGNVQTRLDKTKKEGLDASLLASAGLLRLGLFDLATEVLPRDVMVPGVGQGILAVETHTDAPGTNALVAPLDDPFARAAALAERAFLRRLRGGCQVPIAAHATLTPDGRLHLVGLVAELDGTRILKEAKSGSADDPERLGTELADTLLSLGADEMLARILGTSREGS